MGDGAEELNLPAQRALSLLGSEAFLLWKKLHAMNKFHFRRSPHKRRLAGFLQCCWEMHLWYSLDMDRSPHYGSRMKQWTAHSFTTGQALVPPQMLRQFAGTRGRVESAAKELPRSVTLSTATEQVRKSLLSPKR